MDYEGIEIARGRTAVGATRRHVVAAVSGGMLIVALGGIGSAQLMMRSGLDRQRRTIEALKRAQDRARTSIGALSRRVEALTRAQAAQATTTDIVRSTEGSVVTVFAGSGEGS